MREFAGSAAAIVCALRASMRKSSSSRSRSLNSPTSSRTWYSAPHDVRDSMTLPSSSSTERSMSTCSSRPGRFTFTMTGEPSGSCARYTWPIDAAAMGCQSNAMNVSSTGRVELLLQQCGDRVAGSWGHVVLEPRQLADRVSREQVGARRQDLAELDEHPAALLEREPQTAHGRAAACRRSRPSARGRATARARCEPRCE